MTDEIVNKNLPPQESVTLHQKHQAAEIQPPLKKLANLKFSKEFKIALLTLSFLALAGGTYFWFQNQSQTSYTPPLKQESFSLVVDNPKDGELAVNGEILVTGTTAPNSSVAVFTETDETIVESNNTGHFETTVKLAQGINSLNVTAFDQNGQEKTVSIDVVYDE